MRVRTINELGLTVRHRRRELGWSQEELARRARVTRLWVLQLERGKPTAQIALVFQVLKALELMLELAPMPPQASTEDFIDLDALIDSYQEPRPS